MTVVRGETIKLLFRRNLINLHTNEYIYVGDIIGISSRQIDVMTPFFNVVVL